MGKSKDKKANVVKGGKPVEDDDKDMNNGGGNDEESKTP